MLRICITGLQKTETWMQVLLLWVEFLSGLVPFLCGVSSSAAKTDKEEWTGCIQGRSRRILEWYWGLFMKRCEQADMLDCLVPCALCLVFCHSISLITCSIAKKHCQRSTQSVAMLVSDSIKFCECLKRRIYCQEKGCHLSRILRKGKGHSGNLAWPEALFDKRAHIWDFCTVQWTWDASIWRWCACDGDTKESINYAARKRSDWGRCRHMIVFWCTLATIMR